MKMTKTPEQMFDARQKSIEKRIDIKDKNIAYFNSLNAAISVVGIEPNIWQQLMADERKDFVISWRNFFYAEWEKWYKDTTAVKMNELTDEQRRAAVEEFEKKYKEASIAEDIKAEIAETLPIVNASDL